MDKLYRVVIIDDDEFSADNLCLELKKFGYSCACAFGRRAYLYDIHAYQ